MINYLVKFSYSDFDITIDGFALLTEKDKEFFDRFSEWEHFYLAEEIGEGLEIEFQDYDEWRSHYNWISITKEEYRIISRLIGDRCGYFFYPEVEV